MSRSLYKYNWVVVKEDSKCIDSNSRVAKKIESLSHEVKKRKHSESTEQEGFVQGLDAEEVESILTDSDDPESQNIIKASDMPDEEELRAQAEAIVAEAREQAEAILAQAREQAEAETDRIREEAREQGYKAGMADAENVLQEHEMKLKRREEELEAAYTKQLEEMEPEMVDALTGIYEHIFDVELSQYHQIIIQLIASTMRRVEENKNFLIHVSKDDYSFVSMNKKILQEAGGSGKATVEIVEDITLGKNQCMLETENGIFDCGLDTQMSELTRRLRLLSYERTSG